MQAETRRLLDAVWKERLKLRAESNKLWGKSKRLGIKSRLLRIEADELRNKSDDLCARCVNLWSASVSRLFGNVTPMWHPRDGGRFACELDGEFFEP